MAYTEDVAKALEVIEDATVRETLRIELDKAHATDIAGLKDNSDKLLNEKQAIKGKLDDATKTLEDLDGITVDKYKELEKNIAELTANPGDPEKLRQIEAVAETKLRQTKEEHESMVKLKDMEIVELTTQTTSLNREIDSALCSGELSKALDSVNVDPKFKSTLVSALGKEVFVDKVGEERKVKFRFNNAPFDIVQGIETWAKEKENQIWISAVNNRGAGAGGSGNVAGYRDILFKDMTLEQRNDLFRKDPAKFREKKANG